MDLTSFINRSQTQYHAVQTITEELTEHGFQELSERSSWHLSAGGKYFVIRNGSAVIAFVIGTLPPSESGFALALSHLDSPGLRVKHRALHAAPGTLVVPVECYSSNIDGTWMDKPLTIAGRVVTRDCVTRLVNVEQSLAVIPNIAPHLLREQQPSRNPQIHLSAFFGDVSPEGFMTLVAQAAGCRVGDIADMELSLVDNTPAVVIGAVKDLIQAPRLDNLAAAHASLEALFDADVAEHTSVSFFADNEEIGSRTPQGADSPFLRDILSRIVLAFGGSLEDVYCSLARSFGLSIDAAHAFHPNYPEKYEPSRAPVINHGPVIKFNQNFRYATTGPSAVRLSALAEHHHIPLQEFSVRADMPCGSTVGPVTSARLGVPMVDIGIPLWAMHSVRETGGLRDQQWMYELIRAFYADKC